MLGFDISERTVLRWTRKAVRNPEPAKTVESLPEQPPGGIAAMDFFTLPSLTFGVLYCFFVICHNRRRIPHFIHDNEANDAGYGLSVTLIPRCGPVGWEVSCLGGLAIMISEF
jgi:hypothetical protein